MFGKPRRGLFITGTDTEVGKTYVAALIAGALRRQGHRVGVYKPAASGCIQRGESLVSEDAEQLWQAAGQPFALDAVCPQRFAAPLAPHLAAQAEGRQLDAQLLRQGLSAWTEHCDVVVVEGAGGLLSPISQQEPVADLAADFGYPLIIVAANKLGVINHTLLTLSAAATYSPPLTVAGVILNDVSPGAQQDESAVLNEAELRSRCGVPLLAHVGFGQTELDGRAIEALTCALRY